MKVFAFLFLSLLFGCSQTQNIPQNKVDPNLIKQLSDLKEKGTDEMLHFIGQCNSDVDSSIINDLISTGIKIHSISKDIFTASGNYGSIQKTAQKDYVKWLEAPKESYPLRNN